eukprot:TRINITY_DN84902_c0_g1_i1.p1 TRINITY_DN84902_c0_g1~~TRINITY_DN84902_c0_g1_i1.p1  ORF type:complete len:324 (-),score=58.72 TRINITY_DN84902_c0_g1_i1:165-1136(-)
MGADGATEEGLLWSIEGTPLQPSAAQTGQPGGGSIEVKKRYDSKGSSTLEQPSAGGQRSQRFLPPVQPAQPAQMRLAPGQSLDTTNGHLRPAGSLVSAGQQVVQPIPAQMLASYQDQHQIEAFMKDMLTGLFTTMPEDPYSYMTAHLAARKPAAPPPQVENLCASAALWLRMAGGDALQPEHWRLQRCWLTRTGHLVVSDMATEVRELPQGQLICPPRELPNSTIILEEGFRFLALGEDECARPYGVRVELSRASWRTASNYAQDGHLDLAFGSEDQFQEWLSLFDHFADPVRRRRAPLPEHAPIPNTTPTQFGCAAVLAAAR